MTRSETKRQWRKILELARKKGQEKEVLRELALQDLFFLLVEILGRKDADRDWIYQRCREVQADPDGHLDIWSREHYKSTVITFALTIQDILNDPEITIGIFSFNRPIAKAFLRQIKFEFESNPKLKALFPNILWENPRAEAPRWSEDGGIVVKRAGNPKEGTIEAWGLVDGQPTSKHYQLRVYDDVVTLESVTTPEQIKKTTRAWEMSLNLGTDGGRMRMIGTFYHFADTYREILNRGAAIPRIYPATDDGTVEGRPVLISPERVAELRRAMGPYVFGSQILCNPKADAVGGFKEEWLRFWQGMQFRGLNIYITVDPAHSKKKGSDYSVFMVIGLGADHNYYVIDIIRDRLSLTERANVLFRLHQQYKPVAVGYERYGLQSDIEHFQDRMNRDNYRFPIIEMGGKTPKNDRILKTVPLFENGRIWIPEKIIRADYEGKLQDIVKSFIQEEFLPFPFVGHDDMLDCLARILDDKLGAYFPQLVDTQPVMTYSGDPVTSSDPYDPLRGGL